MQIKIANGDAWHGELKERGTEENNNRAISHETQGKWVSKGLHAFDVVN